MKKAFLFNLFLFLTINLNAQTSLYGKITDSETGEELFGANILMFKDSQYVIGVSADLDGNYSILLDPGTSYTVEVSYLGLPTKTITGVIVKPGQANQLNVELDGRIQGFINLDEIIITEYRVPLIEQDHTTTGRPATAMDIRTMPTKDIKALSATAAGLKSASEGNNITVRGSRDNATDYYIDGIRIRGSDLIPQSELDRLTVRKIDPTGWGDVPPASVFLQRGGTPATLSNQEEGSDHRPEHDRQQRFPSDSDTDPIDFREEYNEIIENPFTRPVNEPYSTFAIDVDRAAYAIVRRDIQRGRRPAANAARTEEMVNYFRYDYPQPQAEQPFEIYTELGECPWNSGHQLLHVGLQGEKMAFEETSESNLVFLIDVSGSMQSYNKLELLKPSFKLLVDQLRAKDKVSIVVYAGAAGLVLPPTFGHEKETIWQAIDQLQGGGSTAGGAGIELAYKIAKEQFVEGGNNRVILATDGDFNVGVSSKEGLEKLIEEKRKDGIFLSVLGFGMGNLKDNRLETLADSGNGNYAYIDNIAEARRVFVDELPSTLYTIAKDVKIQMMFNSRLVKSYRLIGYENRLLTKRAFDDDSKDAGELGAGHTITALYEIIPTRRNLKAQEFLTDPLPPANNGPATVAEAPGNELVTIKLRYKAPDEDQSQLIVDAVHPRHRDLEATSDNFRFSAAVAGFSLLLRDSKYKGDLSCQSILEWAEGSKGRDDYGYRQEFIDLVTTYEKMTMMTSK